MNMYQRFAITFTAAFIVSSAHAGTPELAQQVVAYLSDVGIIPDR